MSEQPVASWSEERLQIDLFVEHGKQRAPLGTLWTAALIVPRVGDAMNLSFVIADLQAKNPPRRGVVTALEWFPQDSAAKSTFLTWRVRIILRALDDNVPPHATKQQRRSSQSS